MSFSAIILEKRDNIARITLNRPDRLNAITEEMIEEMSRALEDIAGDPQTRVLVLTGAGQGFCSGRDLKVGTVTTQGEPELGTLAMYQYLKRSDRIPFLVHSVEVPTIALVNGVAAGAGMDWALACDLRVGSENARFVVGYTRIGLFPASGSTWLMPRLMGLGTALELLFTGEPINAQEAYRTGVLNKLVPAGELEREGMSLAQKIAKGPPIAIRLANKQHAYLGLAMDFRAALEAANPCVMMSITSRDHQEGVAAFREKREPHFTGE